MMRLCFVGRKSSSGQVWQSIGPKIDKSTEQKNGGSLIAAFPFFLTLLCVKELYQQSFHENCAQAEKSKKLTT
jgi:hypothetical protein